MPLKLTVHSRHSSDIRQRRQVTCLPTGSAPAASPLRSHAGVSRQELRSLSWSGGHLVLVQLKTHAPDICGIAVQKASRWYRVFVASPEHQSGARCPKPTCTEQPPTQHGTADAARRQDSSTAKRNMAQHSAAAPRRIWVQSQRGRACCAQGGGLRLWPPSCVR